MLVLDADAVRSRVTLAAAREAVRDAFCVLSRGDAEAPDELAMKLDNGGELHIKGAYLGGDHLAFKSATSAFPGGQNSGFTAVLDAETGAPVAILDDGGWLTEIRTAAASAVSARALARRESASLAILGGGYQAAYQVDALRHAFSLTSVTNWSRTIETTERFAAEHRTTPMGSVAEAVADADIVVCCTPSRSPLLEMTMLRPGTHVIAVGADMVGKRELADDVLVDCDLIVADDIAVTSQVGELAYAPTELERAVSLGDVLTGKSPGRIAKDQITVSDHCGLGIQDAAMAQLVMAGSA